MAAEVHQEVHQEAHQEVHQEVPIQEGLLLQEATQEGLHLQAPPEDHHCSADQVDPHHQEAQGRGKLIVGPHWGWDWDFQET